MATLIEANPSLSDEDLIREYRRYQAETLEILSRPPVWRSVQCVAAALLAKGRLTAQGGGAPGGWCAAWVLPQGRPALLRHLMNPLGLFGAPTLGMKGLVRPEGIDEGHKADTEGQADSGLG